MRSSYLNSSGILSGGLPRLEISSIHYSGAFRSAASICGDPAVGVFDAKPKALGKQRIAPVFGGYLIDGQQRLTSLEAAFGLYTGEDRHGSELRCYLDLAAANDESARDTRLFVSYAGKQRRSVVRPEPGVRRHG